MDEEELEQSNKININSFFQSVQSVDRVAKSALNSSETSLKSSRSNLDLIKALQSSFASLRDEVEQITRYILVEQDDRSKILNQREQEAARREDDIQKGIFSAEDAREKSLQDDKPFSGKNRFLEGITGGLSNIIEQNQDLIAGAGAATILGAIPFNFGGFVYGSGNADTVNAKLTPGEFVVPKDTVDNFGSNFFEGLTQASQPQTNSYSSSIQYSTKGNVETGEIEIDPSSLEPGVPIEAAQQDYYMGKIKKLQFQIRNKKRQFGDDYDTSYMEGELKKFNDKYNSTLEYGGIDYTNIGKNEEKKENKFGNFVKSGGIFGAIGRMFGGDKKNENVKNDDKNVKFNTYDDYDDDFSDPFFDDGVGFDELIDDDSTIKSGDRRGLLGAIGGTIDAATGGLTDLDRRGGKPFGLMRGITGSIDAMTGGLTDLDRRGGQPFGLMRGITGSIDAMTGGLTDLDRRGGKPFGTMRLATGMADAMTGNLFDLDRRGDGKEKKLPPSQDPSHPLYQKIQKLKNKKDQLQMDTTVNPDGSITSKGSGTFIGGELVKPGEPLTPMQRAAITMGLQMGNTYSPEIMEKYNNAGGSPSKEEFENYQKNKSVSKVEPKKEKTMGELAKRGIAGIADAMTGNLFDFDKKNKVKGSSENLKVTSNEAMRGVSQTITQPPDMGGDETIVLPPTESGGDGVSIPPAIPPNFAGANTGTTPIGETVSSIPYIDVISNQYLSIP